MDGHGLGYRIRGTNYIYCYIYFEGEMVWVWYDLVSGERLSFEEVFDGVGDAIRQGIIFHLDLFRGGR
jgi:hypothetical protein